ncbi:hypothetical protein [Cupriavidus sp. D39]|uniref:hypothetical protein n=1 Tax=Cupriavidus sp. D39 TaxID=2997877 RepID=UPI00226D8338|nr:hypothetical protein [Cupriavidus sp. D39]MCY0853836.1 hypothetical protein [Cupriavidus sp. D39]
MSWDGERISNSGGVGKLAPRGGVVQHRKAPANLAVVTLDKPKAFMRLASDVWEFVSTPAWRHESFSVDFIEVPQ